MAERQNNGLGVAGFVCSMVGLCFPPLALLGLILSLIALRRVPRGFAVAGVLVGLLGSFWIIIGLLFAAGVVMTVFAAIFGAALAATVALALGLDEVAAHIEMGHIDTKIVEYRSENGSLPDGLDKLTELVQEDLSDPWGNPYRYELQDTGSYTITSDGRDGVADTAYDLSHDVTVR